MIERLGNFNKDSVLNRSHTAQESGRDLHRRKEKARKSIKGVIPGISLSVLLALGISARQSENAYAEERLGDKNVAVMLLELDNKPDPSIRPQIEQVFTGEGKVSPGGLRDPSVKEYLVSATNGKLNVNFEFFGPYQGFLPQDMRCDADAVESEGRKQAENNNISLKEYNAAFFVVDDQFNPACGYRASTQLESGGIVQNGEHGPLVPVHELGHVFLFGRPHANAEEGHGCVVYLSDPPRHTCEGADLYDPMRLHGTILLPYGLNAPHKIALGLVPDDNIQEVTSSDTYELVGTSAEQNVPGTRILRIKKPDTQQNGKQDYYYLEYMQILRTNNMTDEEYEKVRNAWQDRVVTHIWNNDPSTPTKLVGISDCCPARLQDDENQIYVKTIEKTGEKTLLEVRFGK